MTLVRYDLVTLVEMISIKCYLSYIPGCRTLVTRGSDSKNFATARPFFMCCCIRNGNVFNPRLTKKQSNGEGTGPIAKDINNYS